MNKFINTDDHVLPRPVEHLPEYANSKARRTLAEKLVAAFGLSDLAATAIADAVADPTLVRRNIGEVTDPQVEEIPIPGGTLLGIRTTVWARRVLPDPRNPRIGPSRRHPFAVAPGTGGEDSRFRPVSEPKTPKGRLGDAPELEVQIESPEHLIWASAQAANYVLAENDWRASIASQGVMEAVWLAATTYQHEDGTDPVATLTTVEGSSRTSAVHNLLNIRSADVPYDDYDSKLRTHYRKLNEALDRSPSHEHLIALRCERIPALILVGFRRNLGTNSGFPTAVKSLVALRHVDPPKPWGEGPENESLADEVLDELHRRNLLSSTELAYFAGSCTREQARAAHLSDNPVLRSARIVELFATKDEDKNEAIRVAVTSQSTRKRITSKLCNELAVALIVRSMATDPAKTDQVRRYMRHAFGQVVYREKWESTNRDTDTLEKEALREVQHSLANETITDPGPSSLELAVRAVYPLITTGALNADRGTANNAQPDRRIPSEVLDAMRRRIQGVRQLAQILRDFDSERHLRAVDEFGNFKKREDGSGDQIINDIYLREEFPPAGKLRARSLGLTPAEVMKDRLADFSEAMEKLDSVFRSVAEVKGNDGSPLVEVDGVETQSCIVWRKVLTQIEDEISFWGRRYRQKHGTGSMFSSSPHPKSGDEDDAVSDDVSENDEWEDDEQ